MQKATLIDIAQRTGFSVSTVSRALSGQAEKYRISKKAIEIISREAERCNYTPSLLAKGLRLNKTYTLGLIIPGIDNPYFANIASAMIHEAKRLGYQMIIIDTLENAANEREGISSLMSRKVDGMVIVTSDNDAAYLESIHRNVPMVLIDRHFANTSLPYVCSDNRQGGYDATEYLIGMGHRDILCIQGVQRSMPSRQRVDGYHAAMRRAGLEAQTRVVGNDFTIQNGYLETKLAFSSPNPPSAIFALSNTILLGTLKAIHELGLRIPDDVSIVAFDNQIYMDYLNPAITRISQSTSEMCTLAMRILMQQISGDGSSDVQMLLPPKMVVCNSVRVMRHSAAVEK
ncbi:MAG: LacI family DNA-binding transcriptional regulator [Alistipes sp.]|nr:LacI family DNA-binding transcriptional regulator [Alistipes sp.]